MQNRTHEGRPLPSEATRRLPIEKDARFAGAVEHTESGRTSFVSLAYGSAALRFLPGGIVRLTLSRGDARETEPSFAVLGEPETLPPEVEEAGSFLGLSAEGVTARVYYESGSIELIQEPGDTRFETRGGAFVFDDTVMGVHIPLGGEDRVYGLGEKTGSLDKRGRVYEMWNSDEPTHFPTQDPLYCSIPLAIRTDPRGAVGIFLDEPARSWFEVGKEDPETMSVAASSSTIDLYIILADQLSGVVERYSALTGRMPLPPVWALGFQQSRYSYFPDSRVREVAQTMRDKEIPCDVVYLDIDYMDECRVFTWSSASFPDPLRLSRELAELGMRMVTIVDPGVKLDPEYHAYQSGMAGDHFCRRATGEVYEGAVWAGRSAFPDFTRSETRAWWAELHKVLFENGVAGIWNDMNEPADFSGEFYYRPDFTPPEDVTVHPDGLGRRGLERYHNVYGHTMCEATASAFERFQPHRRPFVLTRAAYAGTQRYAAVWTGDNHSWWEHLSMMIPMVLNMGLSGFPFTGADAGGFQADATPELYARWIQAAAFMPFFRAHSARDTVAHEPWSFGSEVEHIARYYIGLRYSLLPYLYTQFHDASAHGTPVVRPLVWHYPEDRRVWNLNDEFFLGPDMLVAPVLSPGARARSVYLPEGEWYDFWSGELLVGPTDVVARAPLDTLPLFVRAPAALAIATAKRNAEETLAEAPRLHIYPGTGEFRPRSVGLLVHDDGLSLDYRGGARTVREILLSVENGEKWRVGCAVSELQSGFEAAPSAYDVILHGAQVMESSSVRPGSREAGEWTWLGAK